MQASSQARRCPCAGRLAHDTTLLLIAFLLVVALPVHAFVVGFGRDHVARPGTVDTALLKRMGVWLLAAVLAIGVAQMFWA